MAIITQTEFDYWEEIEKSPELERISFVLETLPDEEFVRKLEEQRKIGRNLYPVRYMWNLMVTRILTGAPSMADFYRELLRNPTLVKLCGGHPGPDLEKSVPSLSALYRFWKLVRSYVEDIEKMISTMLDDIKEILPDLGKYVAVDSTVVLSAGTKNATPPSEENQDGKGGKEPENRDGRKEWDAKRGRKDYYSEDGKLIKSETFFGFKCHVTVDTTYGIPLSWTVTPANENDTTQLLPLMEKIKQSNPEILAATNFVMADRGYDSEENNRVLFEEHGIVPVIDKRRMWKQEKTRPIDDDKADNIVYDEMGHLHCVCPVTDEMREMVFMGFEKDRGTLKFRCPAMAYGFQCRGMAACRANHNGKSDFGRVVRIPVAKNFRIFSPVLKGTPKWYRLYNKRSAVERFNFRMKGMLNFDSRNLRGLANIKLKSALSIMAMVGMFLARLRANDMKHLRSFYKPFRLAA